MMFDDECCNCFSAVLTESLPFQEVKVINFSNVKLSDCSAVKSDRLKCFRSLTPASDSVSNTCSGADSMSDLCIHCNDLVFSGDDCYWEKRFKQQHKYSNVWIWMAACWKETVKAFIVFLVFLPPPLLSFTCWSSMGTMETERSAANQQQQPPLAAQPGSSTEGRQDAEHSLFGVVCDVTAVLFVGVLSSQELFSLWRLRVLTQLQKVFKLKSSKENVSLLPELVLLLSLNISSTKNLHNSN